MRFALLCAVAGVVLCCAATASALDEPENVIKYRQQVMQALGAHAAAIAAVVKGEVSFAGNVAAHAESLAAMAKLIPGLFPSGTDDRSFDTRALPKIWQDRARFTALAEETETESARLAEIAVSGDADAIAGQFVKVAKACGGCHKAFRAEKK